MWEGRELDSIIAEHSVLFLGSGFSIEATNRLRKAPPTGLGLRKAIAGLVKANPDDYTLPDLAEYCNEVDNVALFELIYNSFRIVDLGKNQKEILKAPWLRIYTTNFDDAAEVGRQKAGLHVESYSFEGDKPRKISPGAIVHLHGVVRNVTEENVLSQIVLGERAYVDSHLRLSPWYDQFLYDLRFSRSCYFVGYSLSDQHIAALLTKNPRSREKTYFVEPDRIPDRVFASRIEKYGSIEPIGLEGFADQVEKRSSPVAVEDFRALRAFKLMDAQPDRRTSVKPTINETRDFLIHGRLSLARMMGSLPSPIYALPRDKEAERGRDVIAANRSLIVDGRLGNGKSVFLNILNAKLAEKGYTSLIVRDVEEVDASEIEFLKGKKNIILFFDTYAIAQNLIVPLSQSLPDAKFVVEVRSSLLDVRMFEIDAKVPRPFGRVSLNSLGDDDRAQFFDLCKSAGVVLPAHVRNAEYMELRDFLLEVFDSEAIRAKMKLDLNKTFESPSSRKIVTVVFLMQLVQADLDVDFLRLVTGLDPFDVLSVNIEGSQEVLTLSSNSVALRSSIFAEYAMREFVPTSDLSEAVHDCAVYCANRKSNKRYRTLLTLFMQYSRIRPMYIKRNDGIDKMRSLYEKLRWYENIADEPLFWLQFGILEIDEGHLVDARRYLDFAYEKASSRDGFLTYQIDTQYLRLLIDTIMAKEDAFGEDVFEKFNDTFRTVGGMLAEDSHRHFAISVLERVPDAVGRMMSRMQDGEKAALGVSLQSVIDILDRSSADFLAQTGGAKLSAKFKSNLAEL